MTCVTFGVGLDDDAGAGVFVLRIIKHLLKPQNIRPLMGAGGADRCIAAGLIDHQNISRLRWLCVGGVGVVFAQMGVLQAGNGAPRPPHQGAVVKRVFCQDLFQIGGLRRIKVQTRTIQQQTQRWLTRAAGVDGSQKGVLDVQQGAPLCLGHCATPVGSCGVAPDCHEILSRGFAKAQVMPRQRQDAPQPPLPQKATVVKEKPGARAPGLCRLVRHDHAISCRQTGFRRWLAA